jgi:hypothetical protein
MLSSLGERSLCLLPTEQHRYKRAFGRRANAIIDFVASRIRRFGFLRLLFHWRSSLRLAGGSPPPVALSDGY